MYVYSGNHTKHSHTQDDNILKCAKCTFTTYSQDSMKYHYSSRHDPNREKAFVCDFCGKAFFNECTLKRHADGK